MRARMLRGTQIVIQRKIDNILFANMESALARYCDPYVRLEILRILQDFTSTINLVYIVVSF